MEIRPGDWVCPVLTCSNVNFSKRNICNRCGAARAQGFSCVTPESKQRKFHDWICEHCGNANWARRTECNICKQVKPTPARVRFVPLSLHIRPVTD